MTHTANDFPGLPALPADPGPLPPAEMPAPRVPVIGAMPWDRPVQTPADLALFLGGSDDSFTGDLLRLIAKSDSSNRAKLARTYPAEVLAWSIWTETHDIPAPTAASLLGLMLLAKMGGAVPGVPGATVAAAEWTPGHGGTL